MIYFFCRKLRDAASYRQLHFNVIVVANWQQGHKQPFQLARPVASCNRFVFHGINVLQSLVPKQVIENTFFFFFLTIILAMWIPILVLAGWCSINILFLWDTPRIKLEVQ